MDAQTLADAMPGLDAGLAEALLPGCLQAMRAAECTTVMRQAMFLAQVGHESGSLRYTEELASGAAYEGRADLGNIQAGDGPRFRGRGFIQLTGRVNYGRFSDWCARRNLVPATTWFVNRPELVADQPWAWLSAAWYWTVARPQINSLADAGDVAGVTYAINGGDNGLDDRRARWQTCVALGDRLLDPATAVAQGAASVTNPLGEIVAVVHITEDNPADDQGGDGFGVVDSAHRALTLKGSEWAAVHDLRVAMSKAGIKLDPIVEFPRTKWNALPRMPR